MPHSISRLRADINPVTGFTFRDARPFQAGDDTTATNMPFPPIPAAFWGAACAAARPCFGPPQRAYLFGLARGQVDYFPSPLDLRMEKIEGPQESRRDPLWTRLLPVRDPGIVAMKGLASPALFVPAESFAAESLEHRLMTGAQWGAYLRGARLPGKPLKEEAVVKNQMRVGVQLGSLPTSLTAESRREPRLAAPGRLYSEQVAFLDRKDGGVVFRLGLEFDSPIETSKLPLESTVRLGGEGRLAGIQFEPGWDGGFDDKLMNAVKGNVLKQNAPPFLVKLCFLTPTVFSANREWLLNRPDTPAWRPCWLWPHKACRPPHSSGYKLKLVAALVDKARPAGFWDAKAEYPKDEGGKADRPGAGAPKPLYRFLPAGAVYFLELYPDGRQPAKALDKFFEDFWLNTILVRKDNTLSFFGRMGFGITVIGDWNYA